jgi:PAS domain S-box-containing protein
MFEGGVLEKQDMALVYQGMSKDDLVREIMMLRGRLEEGGLPSIPALALEFHLAMVDYLIDYLIGDAPLLVVVLDAEGKIVRINGHFEAVTGRRAADVIGCDYQPLFVHSEGRSAFEQLMSGAREGRSSERGRWPVVDVHGRAIRIEWYNKILSGANGVFAGMLSIGMDVTDRQSMEETLLLTKTSLDQLTDEIYWVTPEAVFDYVNEQACRALGFSKDELLSMKVGDVAPKYDMRAGMICGSG